MAFRTVVITSLMLFVAIFAVPNVHATSNSSWAETANNLIGRSLKMIHKENPDGAFGPNPWRGAHATFYEGGSTSYGGACGYEDVVKDGYGLDTTAALSTVMFNNARLCGACYEIKCTNADKGCKAGETSLLVTATNHCPDGGWCAPPRKHFDIAKAGYLQIAEEKAGIVPVQYRRVPCKKQGGIRFTITGNPNFNLVKIFNVGGAGSVTGVQVKGDNKLIHWTPLKRNFGVKWETDAMLVGETLSFRVKTGDGRYLTSDNVVPSSWKFGQTFEGKNFAEN